MVILDANMILRYLLNDNKEMADKAEQYIESDNAFVTPEVIAETVCVLSGVYSMDRGRISETLRAFLLLVLCREKESLLLALDTYGRDPLDFVDCLLYAYHVVKHAEIATFDKKLLRLIEKHDRS